MAKYRLNLSFDIDINADEEEEISEEEMVKILQRLYKNDKIELLATLRYYFEGEKVPYSLEIKPQKVNSED
jgi:sugar diacid utilization regulator